MFFLESCHFFRAHAKPSMLVGSHIVSNERIHLYLLVKLYLSLQLHMNLTELLRSFSFLFMPH